MKRIYKRITALFLDLLIAASLLASCDGKAGEAVEEVNGIPIFDQYKTREVDLGPGRMRSFWISSR